MATTRAISTSDPDATSDGSITARFPDPFGPDHARLPAPARCPAPTSDGSAGSGADPVVPSDAVGERRLVELVRQTDSSAASGSDGSVQAARAPTAPMGRLRLVGAVGGTVAGRSSVSSQDRRRQTGHRPPSPEAGPGRSTVSGRPRSLTVTGFGRPSTGRSADRLGPATDVDPAPTPAATAADRGRGRRSGPGHPTLEAVLPSPVAGHLLADHLGRAAGGHGHAVEGVGRLHGALLVAHDDQLGLAPELVDQAQEPLQVHVVEGRLHLVHQVEGRRPAAEHGEQEGQGHERALASRQQGQAPHVAAGRPHLDLDPGVQQVLGVGEGQAAGAARGTAR